MSLKNALTKMGLVEEEVRVESKSKSIVPKPSTQVAYTTPSSYDESAASRIVTSASTDPAIVEMLNQSLKEKQGNGFDYLKFIASVDKTKASGVSEDARYKMTFAAAESMGADKASLVKSGERCLEVLKEDEESFTSDCADYDKKEVKSREAKLSQIENSINDTANQLAHLQQDHEKLKQELQDEKIRLESRKNAFQSTLQNFRATIESNIQKINQYL